MKTILSWGGIIVFIILSACSSDEGLLESIDKNGNLQLKYAKIERASDQDLFLEVTDILDNRCPVGVVCCSAGQVEINLNALMGTDVVPFKLEIGKFGANLHSADTIYNHRIQVIDITPYPFSSDTQIGKDDYTIILKVEEL